METNKGTIRFELDEENAPITAGNFINLTERGFYNGLTFHRYVANFVIQGGCPVGDGQHGSEHKIKLETSSKFTHDSAGTVAMARTADPNSASSQFYFTLGPAPHLDAANAKDGFGYAVFGKVTDGLEVVMALRQGDTIVSVTVE
jgi:cyclophilin family peptidyl-prolyl cis-trans isomerase